MVAAHKRKTLGSTNPLGGAVEYSSPACLLHEFETQEPPGAALDVRIKRIYDEPQSLDGLRVLVDRLWPRGIRRQQATIDIWARDLAPSSRLRQWFHHDPARWNAFRRRYHKELEEKRTDLEALRERSHGRRLTLLYAARDQTFNHAAVLMKILRRR